MEVNKWHCKHCGWLHGAEVTIDQACVKCGGRATVESLEVDEVFSILKDAEAAIEELLFPSGKTTDHPWHTLQRIKRLLG